ncbi:MAG: hypothetical protein IBJ12_00570 [Sphingomonadaceae bacterium]|nr:hypothetical protein [Sphingomonadaceae bacterium]
MEQNHPTPTHPDAAVDVSMAAVSPSTPLPPAAPKPDDDALTPEEAEPYNPEDYRWVPVRRRPRYDGWTDEKQRRFIEVLADTGSVTQASKAVGMSRESARQLRRAPHGAAFDRAWDAARFHAGRGLEDIAFDRAIEGVEHHVFDENGEIVCTKRVVSDRLLTFLLSNLMPERYGKAARANPAPPVQTVDDSLRAMEPQLPAPPEEMLGPETLGDELQMADAADGVLPSFLSEQRPGKSEERLADEEFAARLERGKAASEKEEKLSDEEFGDLCMYLDPTQRHDKGRKRYR